MYTYPRPPNLAYPDRVLFDEGPLSRSDPSADRARAGRTGAPRNGRRPGGRWSAGRRSACLGRARCLAARGGFTTRLKGARWCPGASRRSIPSRGSRGTGKPRTLCAARTRKLGCLKFESRISCRVALAKRCFAEPGPSLLQSQATGTPALQRTASQELRAALRPGNGTRGDDGYPYTNARSFRSIFGNSSFSAQ
jgi:hypothetical protein